MTPGADPDAGNAEMSHGSPDLDAILADLTFDPRDPASVEAAMQAMDAAIDTKVAPYALNPDVQDMSAARKAFYRQAIRDRSRAE